MTMYRKAENCGPVPYPDRSGRMLNAGDLAEGADWEPLVALGFVVPVEEPEVVVVSTVAKVTAAPVVDPPKSDTLDEKGEVASDAETNDGAAAEAVDSSSAGLSSDKGLSGRASTGRRR